ncbi:CPBP family intramembrane glutamic endopeptidase [Anaerobranca gottschalkii]|uniref:CAAX prenyl protease 2/Lysostaphin resistance protein A-like domain-containing protein n=1 Tax=Anaerobranca gottschalkii DSM 13577 TaxID=1120990 RepID=A0A1I0B9Y0_9FIRM|nr:CPBP family intramembrane glutamic endopeptidase [Anaerobranca gottschalkii]SET03605.1 hypothetical protein SAMN03080614_10358 [Anaerobranca gottschalkii DSM 13577]
MKRQLKPIHGNSLLLVSAVLLLLLGSIAQLINLLVGLALSQVFLILLPTLVFAAFLNIDFKKEFRLNPFTIKEFLLVTGITFCFYPVAVFSNAIITSILSRLGEVPPNIISIPETSKDFIFSLIVISGFAGICEEFLFRGFIMRSFEGLGQRKALIISSILFGIFHFTLQNLLGPIILGLVIGYIVIRTNSLWMGIYAHMLNNAIALSLGKIIMSMPQETLEVEGTLATMIMGLIVLLVIALIFGFMGYLALKKLKKITEEKVLASNTTTTQEQHLEEQFSVYYPEETPEKVSTPLSWIPAIIVVLTFIIFSVIEVFVIMNPNFFNF